MKIIRRKGFSEYHITAPDDMTPELFTLAVQYCSRCGAEFPAHMASLYLEDDEDYGEDADGEPLAVCRNHMACDGNLLESAAESLDVVRMSMVKGQPVGRQEYEALTRAWDNLLKVYGEGLLSLDDECRCAECLVPIGLDAAPGTLCRFCQEKAASRGEDEK